MADFRDFSNLARHLQYSRQAASSGERDTKFKGRNEMYKGKNSFRTTLAAIACTLVVSTTCLASVVGPAATATADVSTQAAA